MAESAQMKPERSRSRTPPMARDTRSQAPRRTIQVPHAALATWQFVPFLMGFGIGRYVSVGVGRGGVAQENLYWYAHLLGFAFSRGLENRMIYLPVPRATLLVHARAMAHDNGATCAWLMHTAPPREVHQPAQDLVPWFHYGVIIGYYYASTHARAESPNGRPLDVSREVLRAVGFED